MVNLRRQMSVTPTKIQFPVVKGSFTAVKVPLVTAPNISQIHFCQNKPIPLNNFPRVFPRNHLEIKLKSCSNIFVLYRPTNHGQTTAWI